MNTSRTRSSASEDPRGAAEKLEYRPVMAFEELTEGFQFTTLHCPHQQFVRHVLQMITRSRVEGYRGRTGGQEGSGGPRKAGKAGKTRKTSHRPADAVAGRDLASAPRDVRARAGHCWRINYGMRRLLSPFSRDRGRCES